MNKPLTEKEKLLTSLTDIYDQLAELELVVEASFSDHRISLNREEQEKLAIPVQRLADIGEKLSNVNIFSNKEIPDSSLPQGSQSLKLELGF